MQVKESNKELLLFIVKEICEWLIAIVILGLISAAFFIYGNSLSQARQIAKSYTTTEEILVSPGDNLISLVTQNSFPDDNRNEYDIREVLRVVCEINEMENTYTIYAGDWITIPIYARETREEVTLDNTD